MGNLWSEIVVALYIGAVVSFTKFQ